MDDWRDWTEKTALAHLLFRAHVADTRPYLSEILRVDDI